MFETNRGDTAIDKSIVQHANGTIGLYTLRAIAAVARRTSGEVSRPYPTPGYEFVPANPTEKDIESS
ncbi:hypothetical protein BRC77_11240 [Halobacteriales archaeon QH_8_64_26]|nr:MAG: hypothetical protein BRC77_11240 [Halobacteriales archaeon QH_8_64_26]